MFNIFHNVIFSDFDDEKILGFFDNVIFSDFYDVKILIFFFFRKEIF